MPQVDLSVLQRKPVTEGSVQRMYEVDFQGAPHLLAEALDSGSVFDVGIFFAIPGSGVARNSMRHTVFSRLRDPATWSGLTPHELARCYADPAAAQRVHESSVFTRIRHDGVRTHHVGLVDPGSGAVLDAVTDVESPLVLIRPYPVVKPVRTRLLHDVVYDYSAYAATPSRVLALEHVIRLGVPANSSVADRYAALAGAGRDAQAAAFLESYGLRGRLTSWCRLPAPTCDWATKFEDHDRHLSTQEALYISGIGAPALQEVTELLALCTVHVESLFGSAGLTLWDLKWEVAVEDGTPVVVDTVDHDSLRVTRTVRSGGVDCHVHFNKQAVRDYYRILHREWHRSLGEAKRLSTRTGDGRPFMDIYRDGVTAGRYPAIPELDPDYAAMLAARYRYVNRVCLGEVDPDEGRRLAEDELAYYAGRGALADFVRLSAAGTV